jgi:hypothetical protein
VSAQSDEWLKGFSERGGLVTDADGRPPGDERHDDIFAVRVTVQRGQAEELVRRGEFDFGDHPHVTPNPDGSSGLDLFVSRPQIETLRREGFQVEVGSNQSARARERVAEVGQGDRFEVGRVPPKGIGRKIRGTPDDQDVPPS